MVLSVFGISHHTASLAQREPYQIQRRELAEALVAYKRIAEVDEVVIVATCNRVEFYRAHSEKGDQAAEVMAFYRELGVEDPQPLLEFSFRHVGAGAARHLFRVISGMDSLVLGEEQIRAQVKDAYSTACSVGGPGKVLHKLFHHAFRISKKVRNDTILGSGIRSVPGAAVELLLAELTEAELQKKRAVVIGADETTEVVLGHLQRHGVKTVIINRTSIVAEELARRFKMGFANWRDLEKLIAQADYVFTATGSPSQILTTEMVGPSRSARPLAIADLAVPRDVDPGTSDIEGVTLLDLQSMKLHMDRVNARRSSELPDAQQIVEDGVAYYLDWLRGQSFLGGIEEVKSSLHEAANEELQRFRGSFHQSEVKALEAFSHALIKRFIKLAKQHFEPADGSLSHPALRMDPAALEEIRLEEREDEEGLSCREKRALREGSH